MTDGQEYDSLEVLLAEWKPCPCSQCQVEVQLGIHRATVLAWLPTQLLEEVGMGPWQPKELLKCVNCLGQYGGALWGELLQALAPCLQQEELAPALTDEVVAEALGGDLLQACRWLAQGGQAGAAVVRPMCHSRPIVCRPAGRLRQTRVVELGQAVAPMVCQSHAHARAARWGVAAGRAGPAMGRPAGNAATGTLAARRAGPIAAARPSSLAPAVWPVAGGGKGRPGPLAARSVGGAEDQCPSP